MSHIAFIGTGLLGAGMVERMLAQGHAVTVWNRTPGKARALEPLGARVSTTAEEAVAAAERVHFALSDDPVVDEVLDRVRSHLRSEAVVVDHSTTLPAVTKDRLPRCAAHGVRFVHAPVFMSPQMCREGTGIMLVSGPSRLVEALRPALEQMTGMVWYLGERPDLAAAYKLFGNAMLFVIAGGLADVFALAKATGVPAPEAAALFQKFQIGGAIAGRGAQMARGDFKAAFELTMARKDVRLMLETAAGLPLAVLPGLAVRMDTAIAEGHGQEDLGVIAADVVRGRSS
jgi:3-hydroxyisobutyrate dehydrogenase-like beta-hydroxyacid dehydrogenase